MENKKIILKSNEAHNLITSAIASNRVCRNGKLLTPSEVEELIYYLLKQQYNNDLFNIRLTRDCNTEEEIIKQQMKFGDIVVILNDGNIITNEVKSEKPYKGLYYKLRIDLMYYRANGEPYYQGNTGDSLGWLYHCYYDKLYIHFHDTTSKYKASIYVINNPYQLMLDIKKLWQEEIRNDTFEYNKNYDYFEFYLNFNDKYKVTEGVALDLLNERARERYNIDLIHLEIKLE